MDKAIPYDQFIFRNAPEFSFLFVGTLSSSSAQA